MKITKKWLVGKNACEGGMLWFYGQTSVEPAAICKKLISDQRKFAARIQRIQSGIQRGQRGLGGQSGGQSGRQRGQRGQRGVQHSEN